MSPGHAPADIHSWFAPSEGKQAAYAGRHSQQPLSSWLRVPARTQPPFAKHRFRPIMEQTQICDDAGVQELLDDLKQTPLLSAEEFDRAMAAAGAAATGSLALAQWLVRAGLLTAYQIDAILNRRMADLRIGNYDVLD